MRRLAAAALVLLSPWAARAGHTDEPDVDYLAETLDKWDVRLSLTRLDVGVWENIQVGTYPLLWLLRAKNLYGRATPYQTERWAVALQVGILAFNPRDLIESIEVDVDVRVIPAKLQVTWTRAEAQRLTVGIGWAQALTDVAPGESDSSDEKSKLLKDAEATLGASAGRLELAYEYRLSDLTALVAESQIMLFQRFGQGGDAVVDVDDRTTVEIHEKAGLDTSGFHGNLGGAVTWAWDTFHLKLGGYYGHYVLPLIGTFTPDPIPMGEVDLSWRW